MQGGKEMLAAERREKITKFLHQYGSVEVEELAKDLNVSTMTIRRDLLKLQQDGKIERCHGGAVIKQEVTYIDKQTSYREEKNAIAEKCAKYVESGNTVFLDAGTTTYEIARKIMDIPDILVVTNDLEIAQLLKNSQVKLFVCGGYVQKSTGSMFGRYATQMLKDFKFDIGFFGAASINNQFEVMTPTIDKMWLKRETPKQCTKVYLAVDSSKFGRQAMSKINCLSDYTGIVTEKKFSKEEEEFLKKMGANIIKITI